MFTPHPFAKTFSGDATRHAAVPLGGIGAGGMALEANGSLTQVAIDHHPNMDFEPLLYSALHIEGVGARLLEGPVSPQKIFGANLRGNSGCGYPRRTYGLPRFESAQLQNHFPFATVELADDALPVGVKITGFSPFIPGNAADSSLPVLSLTYALTNRTGQALSCIYSFACLNFLVAEGASGVVLPRDNGFICQADATDTRQKQGFFAQVDCPAQVQATLFRGGWFDPLTMLWNNLSAGKIVTNGQAEGPSSPGGALYVPLDLPAYGTTEITLRLTWHVPDSQLRCGNDPETEGGCGNEACGNEGGGNSGCSGESCANNGCANEGCANESCGDECCTNNGCSTADCGGECCGNNGPAGKSPAKETYVPWYATRYADVDAVMAYFAENFVRLSQQSALFGHALASCTLPAELMEAAVANLSILRSPTCLIQFDGQFWAWEGCGDQAGSCHGSCTHVWNYQQALPHLFPALERTLREIEFGPSQDSEGHQLFRASLPVRPPAHDYFAAADGQLGGIMKIHRDWRISGDTAWLRGQWPNIVRSLDYCIRTWDPTELGIPSEPHHNTYDIEFWGPDGMCTSFYIGALKAGANMATALGQDASRYASLYRKARQYMETELFDGEYFYQRVVWDGLNAKLELEEDKPEVRDLLTREGPKYQYGIGCLSDGALGDWLARVCFVGPILDEAKVRSHLLAVHRHNLKADLFTHANPQRPGYAVGHEGGLLLCTWPKGGKPSLPMVYSDEVWTGIEYQVAAHLMTVGEPAAALDIVKTCRARYDGRTRNPFNEYECGHYYARAMASYGMLESFSGTRYDAVTNTLFIAPPTPGDFTTFINTRHGYLLCGVRNGEAFCEALGTDTAPTLVYCPAG